jgi:hypothetical protein
MNIKRIFLTGAIILVLRGGVLLGQEVQKPYSYKFDQGVGECLLIGVTVDQAWSATVKAMMILKNKVVTADKASGSLEAEHRPFAAWNYGITLMLEQRGADVCITSAIHKLKEQEDGGGLGDLIKASNKEIYKAEKKVYDKVVELLYGKVEK